MYFGSEDFMLMLNHSKNRLDLRSNVEGRGGGRWPMADVNIDEQGDDRATTSRLPLLTWTLLILLIL